MENDIGEESLDPSNLILSSRRATMGEAITSLADDPEKAARAVELGKATGEYPSLIYANLDNYEEQHKAALTSQLLSSSNYLRQYVDANPMHAKISNDDYANLDDAGDKIAKLHETSAFERWLKSDSIAREFTEGLGDEPLGHSAFKTKADLDFAASHPFLASIAALPATAAEVLGRPMGGILNVIAGETGSRDIPAMLEYLMMRGDIGVKGGGGGGSGAKATNAALHNQVLEALPMIASHVKAGEIPPRGIHPMIDRIHDEQAAYDAKALKEAEQAVDKTATLGRSPDTMADFVRIVGDRNISVSPEAVRKLYGEDIPLADDGKLGMVPGLAEKLAAAEESGADVQIPLTDWLAKVDPEVRDALRDDIRFRPEGQTKNEKAEAVEQRAALKEAQPELTPGPAEPLPEPLPQQRAAAALEPLYSIGDRKLKLERMEKEPNKLILDPSRDYTQAEGFHDFHILDDQGQRVGSLNLSEQRGGKQLYVDMIQGGPPGSKLYNPNSMGPALMRDLLRQIKEAFPNAETITGHRVSGAREKADSYMKPSASPVVKLDVANAEGLRQLFADHEYKPLSDVLEAAYKPTELLTEHEHELSQAIGDELARLIPKQAEVSTPSAMRQSATGREVHGAHISYTDRNPFVIVSLDGPHPIGTAQHEAIHHLRQQGFFTEGEWSTLERAARDNGWIEKFGIDRKYDKLPTAGKLEEAIAEGFRDWKAGNEVPPAAVTVFERLKQLFENIRARVAEILGREVGWEELFQKVDTGEIGQREGNAPRREGAYKEAVSDPWRVNETKEAANDQDAFGKDKFAGIGAAVRDQIIKRSVDENTHVGDYDYWQKIAEKENIGGQITNTPNGYYAARKYSEDGKTTMLVDPNGNRVVYKDGKKIIKELYRDDLHKYSLGDEPELPGVTRMEDRPAFARDAVTSKARHDRYMKLIEQRHKEDEAFAQEHAEADQKKKQTAEWKANKAAVAKEVSTDIRDRPDVAADLFFGAKELYGEPVAKQKLDSAKLTPEQKALLLKDYYGPDGINPDDAARLFGYDTGDTLVNRLGAYNEVKLKAGMSAKDFVKRVIDIETDRQMELRYGDLSANILEAAKEQATSETQLNILHEETLRLATEAGLEFTLTKSDMQRMARDTFDKLPVGEISSKEFLRASGKFGQQAEDALLKGDAAAAFKAKQTQTFSNIYAKAAQKIEKAQKQLDRTAKTFRKALVPSVEAEYTNHIQNLLQRAGYRVNRTVQNIEENLGKQDVGAFANEKLKDSFGYREIPVGEFLEDPNFRKPIDEMTVDEFRQFKNTIDALVRNGRDEMKIIREGEAHDLAEVKAGLIAQVRTFPLKTYTATKGAVARALDLPKVFMAGSTNMETIFNRFDRADPRGMWNRYITYPLTRAANYEARLQREYSKPYGDLGKIVDGDKLVSAPFVDPLSVTPATPDGVPWQGFTRKNVLAMLQNAGNRSNWNVLARGYGADPDALMQWLVKNTTPEDWARAQKMGKTIFGELIKQADGVYERLNGITVDKIPLEPIENTHGTFEGWYHPLIADPIRKGKQKIRGGAYEDGDFGHASTANGYTKARTGAFYPLDLNFDMVPQRMKQMVHDIAFREVVLETQKVFKDPAIHNAITQHYGEHYSDLLMPYLKAIAGAESIPSKGGAKAAQLSEFLRQNTISTYIGFNPYTALKHGPTAAIMSSREVGTVNFAKAVKSLYGQSPELGLTNSEFAMKWSEELQRRERHWQDTVGGQHKEIEGNTTLRESIIEKGSWLVAQSDMLSAKPTWVARYNSAIEEGLSHGESIDLADRAVRRAHGSTAVTNQPSLVRGGGPLHGWLTSVYGFFGTAMQRRIEIAHKMNDTYQLGKEGAIKEAAKQVPGLAADIFTYVIWPTIVEEWVTGLTTDDRRGWGTHIVAGTFMGLSSSVLYLRDLAHAVITGHDPGVGLLSSPLHDVANLARDISHGKEAFSKQRAGKTIGDTLTVLGEGTGMSPKTIANAAHFGIDLVNGQTHPKSFTDWRMGVTRGKVEKRVEH